MDNLPKLVIVKSNILKRFWSNVFFRVFFIVFSILTSVVVVLYVYLRFFDNGRLYYFLTVHLGNIGVNTKLIPDKYSSGVQIKTISNGSYIYTISGIFLGVKSGASADLKVISIVSGNQGEINILYKDSYSRTYWEKKSVDNNLNRFPKARYFDDGSKTTIPVYLMAKGETFLKEGDLVDILWVSPLNQEVVIDKNKNLSKTIIEKPIYSIVAKIP